MRTYLNTPTPPQPEISVNLRLKKHWQKKPCGASSCTYSHKKTALAMWIYECRGGERELSIVTNAIYKNYLIIMGQKRYINIKGISFIMSIGAKVIHESTFELNDVAEQFEEEMEILDNKNIMDEIKSNEKSRIKGDVVTFTSLEEFKRSIGI